MFRILAAIVLLLFLVMPVGAEPTPRQITVLLNSADDAQQRFFQAFQSQLVTLSKPVEIIQQGSATAPPTGDLVVAVGTRACLSALDSQPKVPVVCTLVPRLAVAEALSKFPGQATALYLDQPFQRQLNLLEQILPYAREVGFIAGPTSQGVEPELAQALRGKGLRLHSQPYHSGDNIVSVLQRFDHIDVVLAYPDPVVFSPENIYPLLLTTYHQNIPTLVFSSAFVDAGALTAVFSTPEQLGAQTAETVAQWMATGQWPRPQYPRQFTVRTNAQVAKSLRLTLPSEQDLQRRLTALEQRPHETARHSCQGAVTGAATRHRQRLAAGRLSTADGDAGAATGAGRAGPGDRGSTGASGGIRRLFRPYAGARATGPGRLARTGRHRRDNSRGR